QRGVDLEHRLGAMFGKRLPDRAGRIEHVRGVTRECVKASGRGEAEHARIPEMAAVACITRRVGERWLLDETAGAKRPGNRQRLAQFKIAVAGLRAGRRDAE